VLESLSAGTPAVASWSSAIPEVGGELCAYFDPLSAVDMQRAVTTMLARDSDSLRQACKERAKQFSWDAAANTILERIDKEVRQAVLF